TTAGERPPPYTPPGQVGDTAGSPAGSTGESQQPVASAQPPVVVSPLKSDSSATTKIALFPRQAFDDMIVCTAPATNASAFCLSDASLASSLVDPNGQGVPSLPSGAIWVNTPPCMSWHWLGTMYTKSGID